MREIKHITKDIAGNIREAREKIGRAYELVEENRAYADWQRDMALQHLSFNTKGHEIAKKMISEAEESNPLTPGMRMVYNALHADLMKETAEVKAMIDGFDR